MSTTVDTRIAVLSDLSSPSWHPVPEAYGMPWDEAVKLLDAYRGAVLREAADAIDARQAKFEAEERADIGELDLETVQQGTAVRGMAEYLRRLADGDPATAHGLREDLFTGPQWENYDPEAEERERDIQRKA